MILVGIPYHAQKRYAVPHLLDWTENQTYKEAEIVMRWHIGPYGEHGAIKQQFEYFRKLAINMTASHLYIMEADTIPPLDVIDRLKAHKQDVVGALYYYRDQDQPAVAWPKENITSGLVKVDGMGTGAVLLSLKALKSFSFYDWPDRDADWPLYDRLRAKGFQAYLDVDAVCKHYIDEENYA